MRLAPYCPIDRRRYKILDFLEAITPENRQKRFLEQTHSPYPLNAHTETKAVKLVSRFDVTIGHLSLKFFGGQHFGHGSPTPWANLIPGASGSRLFRLPSPHAAGTSRRGRPVKAGRRSWLGACDHTRLTLELRALIERMIDLSAIGIEKGTIPRQLQNGGGQTSLAASWEQRTGSPCLRLTTINCWLVTRRPAEEDRVDDIRVGLCCGLSPCRLANHRRCG